MFETILEQLGKTLLTFNWFGFFAHAGEVVDIIIASLKEYFGK